MAEVVNAASLRAGDVFFDPRVRPGAEHLRRVTTAGSLIHGNVNYVRLTYTVVGEPHRGGQMDILFTEQMIRVHPLRVLEVTRKVADLVDGQRLTVHSAEGRLWV